VIVDKKRVNSVSNTVRSLAGPLIGYKPGKQIKMGLD